MDLTIEMITQLGFPIAVTIYLLYERSQFNIKVTECLVKVSEAVERIEAKICR